MFEKITIFSLMLVKTIKFKKKIKKSLLKKCVWNL